MRMARNIASIGAVGSLSLLAACGDPVPPAAQAGLSIHLQQYDPMDPVHGMDRCPPYRHWVSVPFQTERTYMNQIQTTDGSSSSAKAVNNQEGNTVGCSVKPSGSVFVVSGDAKAFAQYKEEKYSPSIVHIRIPQVGSGDSAAKGTLTIQDHASLEPYTSTECAYSVQGGALGVDPGKIWGSVKCENLSLDKSPGSACLVDVGYFVFENCAQ